MAGAGAAAQPHAPTTKARAGALPDPQQPTKDFELSLKSGYASTTPNLRVASAAQWAEEDIDGRLASARQDLLNPVRREFGLSLSEHIAIERQGRPELAL